MQNLTCEDYQSLKDLLQSLTVRHFPIPLKFFLNEEGRVVFTMTTFSRDSGTPTSIVSELNPYTILCFLKRGDKLRALEVLRDHAQSLVIHELDECLYVDGKRVWDPHQ